MDRAFDLQGHRGARAQFPENTLAGFRRTRALGVTSIELDVAITRDGVPVVTHDVRLNADLMRGPDGAWIASPGPLIRDLTLAELQSYDAGRLRPGSPTAINFPRQDPIDGQTIPTLAAVLEALPDVMVDAEIKTLPGEPDATVPPAEMADRVVAVAAGLDAIPRLRLRAFDWRALRHVRRVHPLIPIAWLTGRQSLADTQLWWGLSDIASVARAVAEEAEGSEWRAVWAVQHSMLTQADLDEAHGLGLSVVPWTVNDATDMARLIAWGVDGICTDAVDVLRGVMAGEGMELPSGL
jgi:glycerophosphoryl diester phosphodiesterase